MPLFFETEPDARNPTFVLGLQHRKKPATCIIRPYQEGAYQLLALLIDKPTENDFNFPVFLDLMRTEQGDFVGLFQGCEKVHSGQGIFICSINQHVATVFGL